MLMTPPGWDDKSLELATKVTERQYPDGKPGESQRKAAIQCAILDGMRWLVEHPDYVNAIRHAPDYNVLDADMRKRATFRTTRMLEAALQAHCDGHKVYVMGANYTHAGLLRNTFRDMLVQKRIPWDPSFGTVSFEWPDSLTNFDLKTGVAHMHPNCRVFVDHLVLVHQFGWAFQELNRWDDKPEQQS